VVISLGAGSPLLSSGLPERFGRGTHLRSLWPCSGRGLPCHSLLPGSAVGSYPTFSPLPAPEEIKFPLAAGGLFSVALSRDYSLRVLPGVLPCGARTFLPRVISKTLRQPPLKPHPSSNLLILTIISTFSIPIKPPKLLNDLILLLNLKWSIILNQI